MQSKCILFHRNKQKSCSSLITVVYSVSRCSNGWPFSFMRMRVAKSNPPVNKPTRLMSPKSSGPETDLISEVYCTKLTRHHSKLNSRRRHRDAVFVGYIRATWRGLPARDWILFFLCVGVSCFWYAPLGSTVKNQAAEGVLPAITNLVFALFAFILAQDRRTWWNMSTTVVDTHGLRFV